MNVVSLFAGIEGIGLGFERQGGKVACQVEWDAAAARVLAHHYPDVPRYADVREVSADDIRQHLVRRAFVLSAGFPCQDVSVAGRRAGVAEGTRSGLYREVVRLAEALAPPWLVVENVPGLLSADDGAAFALVLGDLTGWEPEIPDDGWRNSGVCVGPKRSAAWRVLDAQHFGVAQRRRRVFIVCHARDRAAPGAVLLECEGVRGNPPPGATSWARTSRGVADGADTVSTLQGGGRRGYRVDAEGAAGGHLVPTLAFHVTQDPISGSVAPALGREGTAGVMTYAKRRRAGENDDSPESWAESDTAPTIDAAGQGPRTATAVVESLAIRGREGGAQVESGGDKAFTLRAGDGGSSRSAALRVDSAVRRLTPRECERLQGFPDDWTLIPGTSDSARYRQLGNAVCVNVSEWIAWRLMAYENGWRP